MLGWLKSNFDSQPPAGTRVYAVGDIHGQNERLGKLHERILADAETAAEPRRVIVYVGDYIDRGPDAAGVLDTLIERPLSGFDSVFLKGNHEDFMLRFLDGDLEAGARWFANGGEATLTSYGVDVTEKWPDYTELIAWRDALERALPAAHRRFLDTLELSHVEGNYAFVHAGVRPGRPLAAQEPRDLMWIREEFHASKANHGYVVVHGHSVSSTAVNKVNRIGIDTGAGYGRALTAVVLAGTERNFLYD